MYKEKHTTSFFGVLDMFFDCLTQWNPRNLWWPHSDYKNNYNLSNIKVQSLISKIKNAVNKLIKTIKQYRKSINILWCHVKDRYDNHIKSVNWSNEGISSTFGKMKSFTFLIVFPALWASLSASALLPSLADSSTLKLLHVVSRFFNFQYLVSSRFL